jgi:hypothetical protein
MGQLLLGDGYEFFYPRHNFRLVPQSLERRRIIVTSIRDISSDPLDPETYSLNPMLQRGRFLVTGQDLDRGAERSFYLESMTDIRPIQDVSTCHAFDVWTVDGRPYTREHEAQAAKSALERIRRHPVAVRPVRVAPVGQAAKQFRGRSHVRPVRSARHR